MNLCEQFHLAAEKNPNKDAYVFQGMKGTYKELQQQINAFAASLMESGIKKGDHIGLISANTPQFVISLYGALQAGAVVIPINPIYTAEEIGYILNNGDAKAVISIDKLMPMFDKIDAKLPNVENYIVLETGKMDYSQFLIRDKMKPFSICLQTVVNSGSFPKLSQEDLAVILYTSGTTGKPKGAMLTHGNVYSNAIDVADYLSINENDTVVNVLPMFHVFCLTVALNAPLISGGTLLILPRFSPEEVFATVLENKATVFAGVPTMYNFLLQYAKSSEADFSSIRLCISGGASMPVALLNSFEQKFDVRISEGFGMSEASPVTCFNPLDRPRKAGSVGMSIRNVFNKVVDPEGNEVPVGEVGELVVQGPNVMKGYYKMPEETAMTLKDGWLYTGDMARMDDEGYFYIVDRKKDMVIVGGYNVYPREVEEILYGHPEVIEAAVIGIPDPNYGEAVKAFVVVKDKTLTEESFKEYCAAHLAKYKVPSEIEFLEELPKNTTGKILRRSLRELATN
ncbi:fatty acid--CoA ligase family protein [Bacillus solimangrovi]|uniref:Long-chain fatty acid--CoA ligase n=1 Tax=Bacillus solimangrovi TaxID=1305675 RepID=A0A1E5LEC6_9BACI|nr:fatty acid--CoA ligase family protein [Bacillus solimangrovi]OEH92410.1 long-chain fatty acid--CoA ligase [Bacillus solimangrovi]